MIFLQFSELPIFCVIFHKIWFCANFREETYGGSSKYRQNKGIMTKDHPIIFAFKYQVFLDIKKILSCLLFFCSHHIVQKIAKQNIKHTKKSMITKI